MRPRRLLLQISGVGALLTGLLWMGQGFGIVRWPAESAMVARADWGVRGSVLAIAGALCLLVARRRR